MRLAALALLLLPITLAAQKPVIIQTNSAGDNIHFIDPATNRIVKEVKGIEVNHGANLFSIEAAVTVTFTVPMAVLKETKLLSGAGSKPIP